MTRFLSPAILALAASLSTQALAGQVCEQVGEGLYFEHILICATSALPSTAKYTYGPRNLYDWSNQTAWCEGAPGDGAGQEITMRIESYEPFDRLVIHNGYVKSEEVFEQNNRARTIEVRTDRGDTIQAVLPDLPDAYTILLPHMDHWGEITLRIIDTYKGTRYDDTCISHFGPSFE